MARIHYLNVGQGACSIIEHPNGRVSMIDVCCGNAEDRRYGQAYERAKQNEDLSAFPTNPISFLASIGQRDVFRFILSHPDMDHMDGIKALFEQVPVHNFWDTGAKRSPPDFGKTDFQRYKQEDWDYYKKLQSARVDGVTSLTKCQGDTFEYANKGENRNGLTILNPSHAHVQEDNKDPSTSFNNSSYIIRYRTGDKNTFIFPGDAEDEGMEAAVNFDPAGTRNVDVLLAPHHGRRGGQKCGYISHLSPAVVVVGNAPEEHIAFDVWDNYKRVWLKESGTVTVETEEKAFNVFVENEHFARRLTGKRQLDKNDLGYSKIWRFS